MQRKLSPAQLRHDPARPRSAGIDLLKIAALFLVVSVHFFLYSWFYTAPITPEFGPVPITLRWIAYCCVPIFMTVTGYLMKNKTLSARYYLGVLRVLLIYLAVSALCAWFKHRLYGITYTPWSYLHGLLTYTDAHAQYAWYVEYYFCIFLLIPFINAAYHGLAGKKQRLVMLITVTLLTVFSQSVYIGFSLESQIKLLPGYFSRCYPFAYYLAGAYFRDYPPQRTRLSKIRILTVFAVSLTWLSATTYYDSLDNAENGFIFYSWHYNDYGAWPVFVCSTALFLLLFDIPCRSKRLSWVLGKLGNATFAGYLISYCFDQKFYDRLNRRYVTVPERCAHWYEAVLPVFLLSMLSGLMIQGIYDLGAFGIRRFAARARAVSEAEKRGLR